MSLPSFAQIEVVGQCNLRCTPCPIQFRRDGPPYGPPAYLSSARFRRWIDGWPDLKTIDLHGLGEPMMHPEFFEMVGYAARKGIRVLTRSNMTLLSQRKAEACVASGLDTLRVSIDAATPERYQQIRVRGQLDRVIQNVVALRKAKAKLASLRPHMQMAVTWTRENQDELPALIKLAHRLELEGVVVQRFPFSATVSDRSDDVRRWVKQRGAKEAHSRNDLVVADSVAEAQALAQSLEIALELPELRDDSDGSSYRRHACRWPWDKIFITYDGKVLPCAHMLPTERLVLGDLSHSASLPKIWRSDGYEAFREQLLSPEPCETCRRCPVYGRVSD